MKKICLLVLVAYSLNSFSQSKSVSTKVNESISLKIPAGFSLMSKNDRIDKFVSAREPLAVYTSQDREANFAISMSVMQWVDGDEELIRDFYKGTFQSLFDKVEYLQEDIRDINGKKFIVFEFISTLANENAFSGIKSSSNYTYIQYTSYNDQILLFNFGCTSRLMNQWQPLVKDMMESVKIK